MKSFGPLWLFPCCKPGMRKQATSAWASAGLLTALLAWPMGSVADATPTVAASAASKAAQAVGRSVGQIASAALATASQPPTALLHLPASRDELASLQNGARHYLQSCVACHSAAQVSYGQLQDLGMTLADVQVLMPDDPPQFGAAAIVSPLSAEQAVQWFGAAPPDLSLATRTQGNWRYSGADHVYSYLRGFYRDPTTRSGWNNTVVPGTAMPHVLAALQPSDAQSDAAGQSSVQSAGAGSSVALVEFSSPASAQAPASGEAEQGESHVSAARSAAEYEQTLVDITRFMQWMAEPERQTRKKWGWFVCALFAAFAFAAWRLHASYWKDIQ